MTFLSQSSILKPETARIEGGALVKVTVKTRISPFLVILLCMWMAIPLYAEDGMQNTPETPLGKVTISYTLHRIPRIASNQLAVWIETQDGAYINSVFATQFTATGGYKRRPNACPEWVEASDWAEATAAEVDAVAGATQRAGKQQLVWDCTDNQGQPVPAGTYIYKIEGNIQWEERVIWSGAIEVGKDRDSSRAQPRYYPPAAETKGTLLEDVRAVFEPR